MSFFKGEQQGWVQGNCFPQKGQRRTLAAHKCFFSMAKRCSAQLRCVQQGWALLTMEKCLYSIPKRGSAQYGKVVGGGFEIYRGGKRRCGRVCSQGKLASHISNGLELVGTMINILNPFLQLVQTMINILNWVRLRGETNKHLKLVELRGKDDKQAAPGGRRCFGMCSKSN